MIEDPPAYGERKRGITLSEVCQAADAIARQRQRPTVEKIRAMLGSGSPNTVGPMLDEWWARIADRLDSGPAALHRLPEPVAHVAEALWLQALDVGRGRAAAELTSTTRAAEEQSRDLEARAHVLSLRENELEQRLRERERALQESQDQMMQLMRAVQRDQATIRARDTRMVALEAEIERYRIQLKAVLARAVVRHRVHKRRKVTPAANPSSSKRRTKPKKRPMAKRKSGKPRR
ncbi:MAG: DNA-binding protein [Steroidobacteraceae bacterium]|jgi:septal ring factor EnvC (AmiA/AmiB activator)